MLQIRNLTGGYAKNNDILQGINIDIEKGDSVGIIGLNGSGKSTFSRALLNILPFRSGEIFFNGIDITKKSTQELSELGIALFMQGGRIFDELSVWENLMLSSKSEKRVEEIRQDFVLLQSSKRKLLKMRADKLSGGERHQLALIMCVLREPSLLILDEPSAGLSPVAVDLMYQTLDKIRKKNHLTTILIEQHVSKAVDFCNSIVMLKTGKIVFASDNTHESLIIKEIEFLMFNN